MSQVMLTPYIFIVSLLVIGTSLAQIPPFCLELEKIYECSTDTPHINEPEGTLLLTRNSTNCDFKTKDNSKFFALKKDDLKLRDGDTLEIGPEENRHTFKAPLKPGYIATGLEEPEIKFKFANPSDNSPRNKENMRADFLQNEGKIPIDGDKVNDFELNPVDLKNLDLEVSKTIPNPVHLQVDGADIVDNPLQHDLITEPKKTVPLLLKENRPVRVQTSPVRQDCSGKHISTDLTPHDIIGPVPEKGEPYKCVNIYHNNMKTPNAHYDADFENFLEMPDPTDRLLLDNGKPQDRIEVDKSQAKNLPHRKIPFPGRDMAVVYDSPKPAEDHNMQFRMKMDPQSHGGVIDKPGKLDLPEKGKATYVFKPKPGQNAGLKISDKTNLDPKTRMSISEDDKPVANFEAGVILPPMVALRNPDTEMIVHIEGENLSSLNGKLEFISIDGHCHRATMNTSDSISIQGGPSTADCYWTVTSDRNVDLKIDVNDLIPGGCLLIQSLLQLDPIYHQCNLTSTDVLPTFSLTSFFLRIMLPSRGSRFDASVVPHELNNRVAVKPKDKVNITSPGYPVEYPVSNKNQTFSLDGKGKNHMVNVNDLDLRDGERMLINDQEITKDNIKKLGAIPVKDKNVDVKIMRPENPHDFSNRRGFNVTADKFDRIITAPSDKFKTPKNLSSLMVKIPNAPRNERPSRLNYNITVPKDFKDLDLNVVDGRSLDDPKSTPRILEEPNKRKYIGSTTADTALMSMKSKRPNQKLPEMAIDYALVDCDHKDHVCDQNTRCIPAEQLCKGKSVCEDESDLKLPCDGLPTPQPEPENESSGWGPLSVAALGIGLYIAGIISDKYGPDLINKVYHGIKSNQYTSFSSS